MKIKNIIPFLLILTLFFTNVFSEQIVGAITGLSMWPTYSFNKFDVSYSGWFTDSTSSPFKRAVESSAQDPNQYVIEHITDKSINDVMIEKVIKLFNMTNSNFIYNKKYNNHYQPKLLSQIESLFNKRHHNYSQEEGYDYSQKWKVRTQNRNSPPLDNISIHKLIFYGTTWNKSKLTAGFTKDMPRVGKNPSNRHPAAKM